MAIDTVLNPVGMARKLSVPQLQQAIQNGTIPPYVGIPVLQEKIAGEQRLRGAAAMQGQPKQPPIADEIMAKASGLDKLQSNLPTEYAGGGIVSFASGGSLAKMLLADDEEADDDYIDSITDAMAKMDAMREKISELGAQEARGSIDVGSEGMAAPYVAAKKTSEGVTVKEGNRPARTVEHEKQTVVEPKGIDELLAMIQQKESGGRRYDKEGRLLTSPKGAMGEMQVMPGTARDPGFGIRPAEGNNPDELARVGKEYYTKMLERYGDPKIAAIAYNWGPGNTDKWLSAGADPSKLPGETRQYAQGFAEGGITGIKRFQYGGISGAMPYNIAELGLDDLTRMAKMGDPAAVEELAKRRAVSTDPFQRSAEAFEKSRAPRAPGLPAPAAPAAPAAPVEPVRLGPTATQQQPGMLSKLFGPSLGGGLTGPAAAVGAGGAAATGLAGGILGGASNEGLEQLSSDIGSDTGFAAAIMAEGRKTPEKEGIKALPVAAPSAAAPQKKKTLPAGPATGGAGRGPIGAPTGEELDRYAKEQELGSNIDFEDLERGLAAQGMADKNKAEAAKEEAPKESESMAKLRERITKGYEKLDKQEAIDNYLAILSAGLGMMGGSSPFASVNIGKGALQGVQSYLQSGASRAAQEKALMSAELGTERYGQLGQLQREQMLMRKQIADAERERKIEASQAQQTGKAEAIKLRAAEIARKMETDYLNRAETTARNVLKSNPVLSMDEAKSAAFIDQARAEAKAKLNMNTAYRNLMKQAFEGYDPGEIDVSSEINDLMNKYLKPKK